MKLVSALIGLAALGGVALSSGSASAATVTVPAGYVCNEYGHCWHRHYSYGYGYYHPHYYGGWGWHRHWNYGWHHSYWHPHYWGGWGWHRWHYWNSGY